MRKGGRALDQLRPVHMETDFVKYPEGSIYITIGDTKVLCSATIEERVPPFMRGKGKGWITAEYAMLPRATHQRNIRESSKGRISGRTMEIQRLIGRALRSVIDLSRIGERTIWVDCDVIQADGGTRTTSITGAFVAVVLACKKGIEENHFQTMPVKDFLAAVSVGIDPRLGVMLDLCYEEDTRANVDMNVVMTGSGHMVELQGTGEEATFSRSELGTLLDLAQKGIDELIVFQKEILGEVANDFGKGDKE